MSCVEKEDTGVPVQLLWRPNRNTYSKQAIVPDNEFNKSTVLLLTLLFLLFNSVFQ